MNTLDQCLQVIRPLQTSGDIGGIKLADAAIDKFVNGFPGPEQKLEALSRLRQNVMPTGTDRGFRREFGDLVVCSIDSRIEHLADTL